jgi:hypothetical protein
MSDLLCDSTLGGPGVGAGKGGAQRPHQSKEGVG